MVNLASGVAPALPKKASRMLRARRNWSSASCDRPIEEPWIDSSLICAPLTDTKGEMFSLKKASIAPPGLKMSARSDIATSSSASTEKG